MGPLRLRTILLQTDCGEGYHIRSLPIRHRIIVHSVLLSQGVNLCKPFKTLFFQFISFTWCEEVSKGYPIVYVYGQITGCLSYRVRERGFSDQEVGRVDKSLSFLRRKSCLRWKKGGFALTVPLLSHTKLRSKGDDVPLVLFFTHCTICFRLNKSEFINGETLL